MPKNLAQTLSEIAEKVLEENRRCCIELTIEDKEKIRNNIWKKFEEETKERAIKEVEIIKKLMMDNAKNGCKTLLYELKESKTIHTGSKQFFDSCFNAKINKSSDSFDFKCSEDKFIHESEKEIIKINLLVEKIEHLLEEEGFDVKAESCNMFNEDYSKWNNFLLTVSLKN